MALRFLGHGCSPRARAFSLLEFAMVLPVVLLLVLGAVDVNTIIQTRLAMKQAVSTSLRCLYPVDGNCVSQPPRDSQPLYNYERLSGANEAGITYQSQRFGGEIRFLKLPYEHYSFGARTLASVAFDLVVRDYQAPAPTYPLEGALNYTMRTAEYPYITGSDPRNPRFVFKDSPAINYPRAGGDQLNFVSNTPNLSLGVGQSQSNWLPAGRFQIPRHFSSGTCFKASAASFDTGGPNYNPNFGAACEENTAPLVIHLKGSSSGSASSSCAQVELKLVRLNSDMSESSAEIGLGGQEYAGEQSSLNFFPRGAPASSNQGENYVESGLWAGADGEEFTSYDDLRVRYDSWYRIKLRIIRLSAFHGAPCGSGPLRWNLSDIDFYSARDLARADTVGCLEFATLAQGPGTACTPQGLPAELAAMITQVNYAQTELPSGYSGSEVVRAEDQISTAHARLTLGLPADAAISEIPNAAPQFLASTLPCPPNYGVPEPAGPGGYIENSPAASVTCPAQLENLAASMNLPPAVASEAQIQNLRWLETGYEPLPHPGIERLMSSCNMPAFGSSEVPAELRVYPKLNWTRSIASNYHRRDTGPESPGFPAHDPRDPLVLVQSSPEYNCGDITAGFESIASFPQELRAGTLFDGEHPNMELCNWREMVANEARARLQVPANVFFSPARFQSSDSACGVNTVSSSCTIYRACSNNESRERMPVPGGPFPAGITPPECMQADCVPSFAGYSQEVQQQTEFDSAAASEFARRELQSALPWARWNCEGSACARIEFSPPTEQGLLQAHMQIAVPLFALGGNTVSLEFSDSERWEGEFVR